MSRTIAIFDTTLRDGEQSPGCSMTVNEKVEVARQLEELGVDVIEAGFAVASKGDFESIRRISRNVRTAAVASLARALPGDIEIAWEAISQAAHPRIHTFISTSDIHMARKLKKTRDEVLEIVDQAVRLASGLCPEVEFSAEDATRSDPEFLCRVIEKAIRAGASVVNIPDTVGYTTPHEYGRLIARIRENVPGIDKAVISVHCHNDLGMAVANTLAAALAGVGQVECTINGIGERAGNAALEEIVMALKTRRDVFDLDCGIDTQQIYRTSRLVSSVTGTALPPNKAVVGANAFAHESGIHQHGVLSDKSTYEIMCPEAIGLPGNQIVLGKHSGKHAFESRVKSLGYNSTPQELDKIFERFKELADKKKTVSDLDIEALIHNLSPGDPEIYKLDRYTINSGNTITPTASIRMIRDGAAGEDAATGDGPMDAAFRAIEKIIGTRFELQDFFVRSVTGGKDAQGEVVVKMRADGRTAVGRGLSTDIIGAGIHAYLNAANKILAGTAPAEPAK